MSDLVNTPEHWETSKFIAESFKEKHETVLIEIERFLQVYKNTEYTNANFKCVKRNILKRAHTETDYYKLTDSAFNLVVMRLKGEIAMAYKVALIKECNRMRAVLENGRSSK